MARSSKELLNKIRQHVGQLLLVNNALEREVEELQNVLQSKEQAIEQLNHELATTRTKYQNLKMARDITSDAADVQVAKNRFNKLVREIDKCISLLNE